MTSNELGALGTCESCGTKACKFFLFCHGCFCTDFQEAACSQKHSGWSVSTDDIGATSAPNVTSKRSVAVVVLKTRHL